MARVTLSKYFLDIIINKEESNVMICALHLMNTLQVKYTIQKGQGNHIPDLSYLCFQKHSFAANVSLYSWLSFTTKLKTDYMNIL